MERYNDRNVKKLLLCAMQTVKAQISLCIHTEFGQDISCPTIYTTIAIIMSAENEDTGQTVHTHRLRWVIVIPFRQGHFFHITKTCLYKFDPLKPHFYIVKLGFTGVYIIFHISAQSIDCGHSLEPPRGDGSYEYHNLCFEQKYETLFLLKT